MADLLPIEFLIRDKVNDGLGRIITGLRGEKYNLLHHDQAWEIKVGIARR